MDSGPTLVYGWQKGLDERVASGSFEKEHKQEPQSRDCWDTKYSGQKNWGPLAMALA